MLTTIITGVLLSQPAIAVTPAGAILGQEALSLAAAPSGTKFAAGMADKSIKIFDAKTRATTATLTGHNFPARAVAWSPKGDKLASGSENGELRIWNLKTGATIASVKGAHIRNVNAVWFNAQGTRLISTGDDDVTEVWDVAAFKKPLFRILGKGANIYGSRWDPSGQRIVAGSLANGVLIYNGVNGVPAKSLGGHPGVGANDVDLNTTGTRALSAGRDNAIGLWDLKKGQRISYLRGHEDWVTRVKFDPTGRYAASSSTDGTVRVWDVAGMKSVWRIDRMSPTGSPLAWVAGGNLLATIGDDNYIHIFTFARYKPAK
jgi:WD40 repeat protein